MSWLTKMNSGIYEIGFHLGTNDMELNKYYGEWNRHFNYSFLGKRVLDNSSNVKTFSTTESG